MTHFWDAWKFSVDHYTREFRYPTGKDAWDLFVVYRPGQRWERSLPRPVSWFQNHDLDIGPKYDRRALEQTLLRAAGE